MKRQLVIAAVLFAAVASARAATTGDAKSGTGTDGGACKVTGGANNGKTGTFTEGGTWCEGTWGGTECGTSKCKAAAKSGGGIHGFPAGQVTVMKGFLEASEAGASPAKMKAWEQKYHAKAINKSNGAVVITVRNQTLTFDSSKEKLATRFK